MWPIILFCTASAGLVCADNLSSNHSYINTSTSLDIGKQHTAVEDSPSLRKCCDPESVLSSELVGNDSYIPVCLPASNFSSRSDVLPLRTYGSVAFGFPESCPTEDLTIVDLKALPLDACVDKLVLENTNDMHVVGIKCKMHVKMVAATKVTSYRKCCPRGFDYERKYHTCRPSNRTTEDELKLLDTLTGHSTGFVNLVVGIPECKTPHVLVDFLFASTDQTPDDAVCIDHLTEGDRLGGRRCVRDPAICDTMLCIPKCCPPGNHFPGKRCKPTVRGFNPVFYDTSNAYNLKEITQPREYGVIHGLKCKRKQYILDPASKPEDAFYLSANGSLFVPHIPTYFPVNEYCLDDFILPSQGIYGMRPFVCFPEMPQFDWTVKYYLMALGMIVSCVFLVSTLLVYVCLPTLHGNLHGKILMMLVASYTVAFICLAIVQFGLGIKKGSRLSCKVLGFIIALSWLATFAWLNVMCFDIWRTFGATRSVNRGTRKKRDRRRLCFYGLYAWGLPLSIVATTLCVELVDNVPLAIKPNIGTISCWFQKDNYGELIFFITPSGVLIFCNIVLFILTARYCSRVKAEISRMQTDLDDQCKKRFQADKKKLIMNGKLFVVMGVSWSFEIIGGFFDRVPELWYLPDIFNILQGIFIFSIFVLKPKVLRALANRLKSISCCCNETPSVATPSRLDPSTNRKISASSTAFTTTTTLNGRISPARHLS